MKSIIYKLGRLANSIITQRGEFTLYALMLPDNTFAWDLLVAAQWIEDNKSEALRYLVKQVQQTLTKDELLSLSGIVLLSNNEFDSSFSVMKSDTGWEENDIDFLGRHVQKAYIFAAPLEGIQIQAGQ